MGKAKKSGHPLSEFVKIYPEKPNGFNHLCRCIYCIAILGEESKIYKYCKVCKITFKQCEYFKNAHTLEEQEEILNRTNSKNSEVVIAANSGSSSKKSNSILTRNTIVSNKIKPLDQFIARNMNDKKKKFDELWLHATISTGMAFCASENPELQAVFTFLNPNIKLPNCQNLAGTILDNAASCVQDDAAAYAAARSRLQIKHREKIYLPCFAHQINLCVGEIFKENNYRKKRYPFDNNSVNQILNLGNIFQFWSLAATNASELGAIAKVIFIFSICVNSASYKRLISTMVWVHSNLRNRLDPNKVLKISQIHGSITYTHRVAEAKTIKEKYLSNIVIPPNNETESMFYEESDIQESQDLLTDLHETVDTWIGSLEYENLSELTTEHYLDIDIDFEYNEFVENTIHPVHDPTAKWELAELFIEDLEVLSYFYQFENKT
ncbi:1491_t:CDS:2 [Gigaspora rosea]|nr:1491_t:CDS:2 [Gigaspora rosea]